MTIKLQSQTSTVTPTVGSTPADQRRTSWAPMPAEGAYSPIPCWRSRKQWCRAVKKALSTPAGRAALSHKRLGQSLVMRVAGVDAATADFRTGRNLRTAHETVARNLNVSRDAVKKARAVLTRLGFMRTVIQGRYLTAEERRIAAEAHGGHQRRIASTRALTQPQPSTPLPRQGSTTPNTHQSLNSPTHARSARKGGAPRRAKTEKKIFPAVSLPAKRLAARLLRDLPAWAARVTHANAIARVLDAHPQTLTMTSRQIMTALDDRNRRLNLDAAIPTNPVGYLRATLPSALAMMEPPEPKKMNPLPRPKPRKPLTPEAAEEKAAALEKMRALFNRNRTPHQRAVEYAHAARA